MGLSHWSGNALLDSSIKKQNSRSSHGQEHGWTKKENRKIENRGEKRRSVIHTDSVVMKGIESFIITGRTEGVPSIF